MNLSQVPVLNSRKFGTVLREYGGAAGRTFGPFLVVAMLSHAQGTIDMSGATTAVNSLKTFAEYAGAVICLVCLIWAGIKMMGGRFQDAIPQLFGALFGAGVLGWGAGWISSLTGQTVS